jgi:hypothetical protein
MANGSRKEIDVFDADQWKAMNWLPDSVKNNPVRFALFKRSLERSKGLNTLLRSVSPNVLEVRFAGDAHPTNVYFAVKEGATSPSADRWYFSKDLGDGTVPVWSAARNATFDNLAGTAVSFAEHATLFDDNWAQDELKRELLSITPVTREEISGRGHPVITIVAGGVQLNWTIKTIELSAEQPTYLKNETFKANATINLDGPGEGLKQGLLIPVAMLRNNSDEHPIAIVETTSPGDIAKRQLTFKLTRDLATEVIGAAEIEFSIPAVRDDAKAVDRIAIIGN